MQKDPSTVKKGDNKKYILEHLHLSMLNKTRGEKNEQLVKRRMQDLKFTIEKSQCSVSAT